MKEKEDNQKIQPNSNDLQNYSLLDRSKVEISKSTDEPKQKTTDEIMEEFISKNSEIKENFIENKSVIEQDPWLNKN